MKLFGFVICLNPTMTVDSLFLSFSDIENFRTLFFLVIKVKCIYISKQQYDNREDNYSLLVCFS